MHWSNLLFSPDEYQMRLGRKKNTDSNVLCKVPSSLFLRLIQARFFFMLDASRIFFDASKKRKRVQWMTSFVFQQEMRCGYVILIMAIFWVTEALPLHVTALVPVFAFPLLGILSTKEVCSSYMEDPVMLFFGALMLASAIEQSGLNKRIALFILLYVGEFCHFFR